MHQRSPLRILKENSFGDLAWQRFIAKKMGVFGLSLVLAIIVLAIFAPVLAIYAPNDASALFSVGIYAAPSFGHPFGTDRFGYDIYSRVVYGARTALMVGLFTAIIAALIGITVGALAAYFGGQRDEALMRFAEAFLLMPSFVVILFLVRIFTILSPHSFLQHVPFLTLWIIIFTLGIFDWPPIARVCRTQVLKIKEQEFVEAARCLGSSTFRTLFSEILPSAIPPIIVLAALEAGNAILSEAMISFLGFGDPAVISWGQMLRFAAPDMALAPWAAIIPGFFIFVTILGFNILADALGDALNPRLKE
jgi:ABC-type dipeptide/oligopeptide/nickel transport system permease subunit